MDTRPTRPTRPGAHAPRRRPALATLGVLCALALAVTAGAPSVITLRPGDTLWDLARTHGTSVSELQRLNGLSGNSTIYAGRTLRVSGAPASTGSTGSTASLGRHVVRRGETLSHLALRYRTTTSALQRANGLSGTRILVGQRLTIPSRGSRSAGAAPLATDTTNAGNRIPGSVQASVRQHRATLAARSHPSKAQIRQMVAATARRHGVPPSLAVSVAYQESGFKQHVVSGVDAIGVMQVLPSTGRVVGQQHGRRLDLLDTQDNITAGVLLLRQLRRSTGSDDRALAGYYQGLGSISRKGVLPQTHRYIASINTLQGRFPKG